MLGTILLIFPISSSSGNFTSPIDALFTATSAVCVTGLVVVDTGTYWSTFGQAVLLVLFQLGGFGFFALATLILLTIGGGFGLRERLVISESMGIGRLGGIIGIVAKIAVFSLVIEGIGAAIFYVRWLIIGEPGVSLWTAVFHSISAFNNCGMDLFGSFQSLAAYQNDVVILITTSVLILLGSIGYIVIMEYTRKRNYYRLSLDSKLILVISLALVFLGTLFYFIAEYANPATLGPLALADKLLVSFFQTVTVRTAGFSTIDIGSIRQITIFFTVFLMFIGGAAGSAAGGVKVNTFGILVMTVINTLRGKTSIEVFKRQIGRQSIYLALTVVAAYLLTAGLVVTILSITETFPIDNIIFETFSALSTVGASTGITPELSVAGRIVVVITMIVGRLGPLALVTTLARHQQKADFEYPQENIRIG